MTEFSILCLFGSLVFNAVGIHYKFFPPKKYKWWTGAQFRSALTSEEAWREANSFIAFPSLIAGTVFIIIAFFPEIFPGLGFLNFRAASFLILITGIILVLIADRHIRRTFDEHGNRKN